MLKPAQSAIESANPKSVFVVEIERSQMIIRQAVLPSKMREPALAQAIQPAAIRAEVESAGSIFGHRNHFVG